MADNDRFKRILDAAGNDEATALAAFAALAHKFGWAGPLFTRMDIEKLWHQHAGTELSDEAWEMIRNDHRWLTMHKVMNDVAWKVAEELVKDISNRLQS